MHNQMKVAVRSLYDAQKLRIEMSNRLCAQIRGAFIGYEPRETGPDRKAWLKRRSEFNTGFGEWADTTPELPHEKTELLLEYLKAHEAGATWGGVITIEWYARLLQRWNSLLTVEKEILSDVKLMVKDWDIADWLNDAKGCGPAMSGVILSEIQDPAKFDTVSKLWAYCGLHVIDGRAARRKRGEKANWNGFLKTKLVGVLGPSFLKCNSPYRTDYYDPYKNRLLNRSCSMTPEDHNKRFSREGLDDHGTPAGQMSSDNQDNAASHESGDAQSSTAPQKLLANGCTLGHMHNKATRYMVKMFLRDLYVEWRALRGLETRPPYAEEYLEKVHVG